MIFVTPVNETGNVNVIVWNYEDVDRSERLLADKGRRCRNEAVTGGKYCRECQPAEHNRDD